MPKLIIIEGIDSTGKTSLTAACAAHHRPVPMVFHATASRSLFPGLFDYHMNLLRNVQTNLNNGLDVVMDRFWPSEFCYGAHFRPESGWRQHYHAIKDAIAMLDHKYVWCHSKNAWTSYVAEDKFDPAHHLNEVEFRTIEKNYEHLFMGDPIVNPNMVEYTLEHEGSSARLKRFVEELFE